MGSSGGLILLWNTNAVAVLEILKGEHSILVRCCLHGASLFWTCTTVYAPSGSRDKSGIWQEPRDIARLWPSPWILFGDFNTTRSL